MPIAATAFHVIGLIMVSLVTMYESFVDFYDYLGYRLPGGPRFPMYWAVNLQKCCTLPFVLFLMLIYGNYSVTAFVYAGLHGSYGLCWFLKHLLFRDRSFDRLVTLPSAMMCWIGVVGPYWLAPYLVVSRNIEVSSARICFAIVLFALGVVLMIGADAQKTFVLRIQKGLITDGFFSICRHPNYLGEMMLYSSFAVMAKGYWGPWFVLFWVWSAVFAGNIYNKEKSMSRYPEWEEYCRKTSLLFPIKWVMRRGRND